MCLQHLRVQSYSPEIVSGKIELKHPEKHKNPRKSESVVPSYFLTYISTQKHSEESSGIDSHIEDSITRILFGTVVRIKLTYHRGDIWFEHPITENQKCQSDKEEVIV